jgi:hypothetical protein
VSGSLLVLFGAFHFVLGAALFGLVGWFLLGDREDGEEGQGGGGCRVEPSPWRPRPGGRAVRRGPARRPPPRLSGPTPRSTGRRRRIRA